MLPALYRRRRPLSRGVESSGGGLLGWIFEATFRRSREEMEAWFVRDTLCPVSSSSTFFLRLGKDCMGDGFLLSGSLARRSREDRRVGWKTSRRTCSWSL